jgi:hypothetical protein
MTGAIVSDPDILALYYASPLIQIAQRLIGYGEVAAPQNAQIIVTPPSLHDPPDQIGGIR